MHNSCWKHNRERCAAQKHYSRVRLNTTNLNVMGINFLVHFFSFPFSTLWFLICPAQPQKLCSRFSLLLFPCVSFVIFKLNFFFVRLLPTIFVCSLITKLFFLLFSIYCASKFSGKLKSSCRPCPLPTASERESCFINFEINELSIVQKFVRLWTGNFASREHFRDSQTIFSFSLPCV